VNFDEGSAIDYIDIFNGGLLEKTEEKIDGIHKEGELASKVNIKTGILFQALKPLLNIDVGASAEGNISKVGDKIIKNTISNTVLTDFITISEDDHYITKLENCKLVAYKDSFTYYKMYTPYLKMMNKVEKDIDLSRMDETLEAGKGYYELLVENHHKQVILRFNINTFRNNYNLSDLTRMKLKIFCVQVGTMKTPDLNMVSEFESLSKDKVLTIESIEEEAGIHKKNDTEEVNVYDVILAGTMLDV